MQKKVENERARHMVNTMSSCQLIVESLHTRTSSA